MYLLVKCLLILGLGDRLLMSLKRGALVEGGRVMFSVEGPWLDSADGEVDKIFTRLPSPLKTPNRNIDNQIMKSYQLTHLCKTAVKISKYILKLPKVKWDSQILLAISSQPATIIACWEHRYRIVKAGPADGCPVYALHSSTLSTTWLDLCKIPTISLLYKVQVQKINAWVNLVNFN